MKRLFFQRIDRCIDVFVPNICASALPQFSNQRTMKGLALEIDGPIHDNQLKMKKDISKYQLLHQLGIGVVVIENRESRERTVLKLIEGLRSTPKLDSRARKRLWVRIYLNTILYHCDDQTLERLWGKEFFNLQKKSNTTEKKELVYATRT